MPSTIFELDEVEAPSSGGSIHKSSTEETKSKNEFLNMKDQKIAYSALMPKVPTVSASTGSANDAAPTNPASEGAISRTW